MTATVCATPTLPHHCACLQAAEEAESTTKHRLVMNVAVNKQLNEVGCVVGSAPGHATVKHAAPCMRPNLLSAVQEAESLRWIQEHWHEIEPSAGGKTGRSSTQARPAPTLEQVHDQPPSLDGTPLL